MQIFTDADCSRSIEDRRSTTGYCTYVWENFVTWKNKKQNLAARRSAKPDFSALLHKEWVTDYGQKSFWEKLRITRELPVKLYYNKNVAISISLNPVQHDRTKNVEVDRHFIKEKVENGIICLAYILTKKQTADIFTKGLSHQNFNDLIGKLDMINIYDPTLGGVSKSLRTLEEDYRAGISWKYHITRLESHM